MHTTRFGADTQQGQGSHGPLCPLSAIGRAAGHWSRKRTARDRYLASLRSRP
jgi:hypothetical protein